MVEIVVLMVKMLKIYQLLEYWLSPKTGILLFKKPKLAKFKKSDLKNYDFAKANSFGMDFLAPQVKKTFIQLQKSFIEALILYHFESKSYIRIETDASDFSIGEIPSELISV